MKELENIDYITIINAPDEYYTGAFYKHDAEHCSDCIKGNSCQYDAEREFMKLGYLPLSPDTYTIYNYDDSYIELRTLDDEYSIQIPIEKWKDIEWK